MKYSEFETEVEKMGFYIGYSPLYLFVVDRYTEKLASISKEFDMWLDTEYPEFPKLPQEQRAALFDLLYVIAKTPLAEREEEKLYRVKFPAITRHKRNIYLTKEKGSIDPLSVDWSDETYIHDRPSLYTFTEKEIKDIDERYLAFKIEVTP